MISTAVLSDALVFGLAVGVMAIGLAGIFLPVLPGLPLVWLAALGYALVDGFHKLDGWTFAFLTILTMLGTAAEFLGGQLGVRLGGASGRSGIAALIGGLVGMFAFTLVGAVAGAMLAVFLYEISHHRDAVKALRATGAWLVGTLAGRGAQLAVGVLMIAVFAVRVLLAN